MAHQERLSKQPIPSMRGDFLWESGNMGVPIRQGSALSWVKLEKYTELTGDTPDAVNARRKQGKWLNGIHVKVVERRIWVNLIEANKWVEEWEPEKTTCVALKSVKASRAAQSA